MSTRHNATRMLRELAASFTFVAAFYAAQPAGAEPIVIASTFDADTEGWGIFNDGNGPTWVSTGGVEGGYLSSTDKGQGTWWYFRAPAKFLGNKATAYGQDLAFHLKQSATDSQDTTQPDVVLVGGGLTLVYSAPDNPGTAWTPYTVRLDETAMWVNTSAGGTIATAADLQAVLANLMDLRIRGEYRSGIDTGGLDSVTMTLSEAPPPPTFPVVSTFDVDDEGWRVVGDAQGNSDIPNYLAAGGNPDGHLSANDNATGGIWYWRAPGKFLGDISASYGSTLAFDLKQSTLSSQIDRIDVSLSGDGITLVYDTPNNPGLDWTRYVVPLSASANWRVTTLDGPQATDDDWQRVLGFTVDLRIRGEYVDGDDIGGLDNVVLGGTPNLWGDANGNGVVEWSDVGTALGAGGGLRSDGNLERGDVAPRGESSFGDDRLDRLDAIRIARFLGGLEPEWP